MEYPYLIHEKKNSHTTTVTTYDQEIQDWVEQNVSFGFRVQYIRPGVVHLTIHKMDERPGYDRLVNDHVFAENLSVGQIWHNQYNHMGGLSRRHIGIGASNIYVTYILTGGETNPYEDSPWLDAIDKIQKFLLDPGTEWDGMEGDYATISKCPIDPDCQIPAEFHNRSFGTDFHRKCLSCDDVVPYGYFTYRERVAYLDETHDQWDIRSDPYCNRCKNLGLTGITDRYGWETCVVCNADVQDGLWDSYQTIYDNSNTVVCRGCQDEGRYCYECDRFMHYDDTYSDDYDSYCESCYDSYGGNGLIRAWDYMPALEFHPEIPDDPVRPLYIGIELEMSWPGHINRESKAQSWLQEMYDRYDHLLYAKYDSSVSDGFEVVTHPMAPDWAMQHFPFDFFQKAIEWGAKPSHPSCGTHIHIDKAALTTAQMWKMLQIHMRLSDFCGTVGGRGMETEYAAWSNDSIREEHSVRKRLKEIARLKQRGFTAERYLPVNVQNTQTLELRYMAGGIEPETIRKNIEWVQTLYDFTDLITSQDVRDGVIDNPNYLVGWIFEKTNFTALQSTVAANVIMPTPLPERTR